MRMSGMVPPHTGGQGVGTATHGLLGALYELYTFGFHIGVVGFLSMTAGSIAADQFREKQKKRDRKNKLLMEKTSFTRPQHETFGRPRFGYKMAMSIFYKSEHLDDFRCLPKQHVNDSKYVFFFNHSFFVVLGCSYQSSRDAVAGE